MKIVADEHIPYIKDYFSDQGDLLLKPGREITKKDVKDADMLLVRSVTHVDAALLKDSSVKFVGSVTAGADHLDTEWLDNAGIAWRVARGFNAPPVADYVVSVIAAAQSKYVLGRERLKAAVIGVGHVGRLVAECFKLLNIDVMLCDPLRAENEKDFHSTALNDIADVDIISLHVPLVRSGEHPTYHFIDQAFLRRQIPGCVLINASRGAVIDSQALMQYGKHLFWCFDVWEHEPKIDKEILERTLISTPHIAGYSVQSKIRGVEMIYQAACEMKIITPTSKPVLEMPRQQLSFAGEANTWRDMVLGVFNPLLVSFMMRSMLLPAGDEGKLFDEMRHQFNYRHEFGFTDIVKSHVSEAEKQVLRGLSFQAI